MTPTPAQRVALEAIRDGKVERYHPEMFGREVAARWVIRSDEGPRPRGFQIAQCVNAGWARCVGRPRQGYSNPVELTDAGREALA